MPKINPKHGACSCSMVYNPNKYVSRGGDLTGTSGDIGILGNKGEGVSIIKKCPN